MAQGRGVRLWEEALRGQIYLGEEDFVVRLQAKGQRKADSREIPRAQRRAEPRALEWYLRDPDGRQAGMLRAYREGGYTQSAIARALRLSVSRISRIISALEAKGKT